MEIYWFVISSLSFLRLISAECTVDSESENKYKTYLDPLKSQTINVVDDLKEWKYTIRFCEAVVAKGLTEPNAGVIQSGIVKNQTHVIGKITATDIKLGNDWILLTYQDGDIYGSHCGQEARKAHIMLICNSKRLVGSHRVIEENKDKDDDCSYIFEVESSAACTVSIVSPIEGLSIGSIIVIMVLSLIVAYIILGFIYKRFFIGAKGIEQFPNVTFWKDFGNLVADGCELVFRSKRPQESRSYKGLGDDQLGFDEDEERDDHMLPM